MAFATIEIANRDQATLPFRAISRDKLALKAMSQALSDILRKYRTEVKRELVKRTQLPASLFTPRVKVDNVKQKSLRSGTLNASIWIGTNRIPVIKTLRAGQTVRRSNSGLVVGSKTKDKYSLQRGSFLATMPGGKTGIYRRIGKSRLPIEELVFKFDKSAEDILIALAQRDEFVNDVENLFFRKLDQYLAKL